MTTPDQLLDYIVRHEAASDWGAISGFVNRADYPDKPVTEMTLGAVLDWQAGLNSRSTAVGGPQFIEPTLRGLYREAGVPLTATFNEATQRKLAKRLLKRRGMDDYLAGRITAKRFAQNLSMEWAALPCTTQDRNGNPAQGQSYYAGDGLNKAGADLETFLDVVSSLRGTPEPEPAATKTEAAKQVAKKPSFWTIVTGLLAAPTLPAVVEKIGNVPEPVSWGVTFAIVAFTLVGVVMFVRGREA